ncbi:MAG: MMPL family transporter [Planctomycetaceae bacterium]
MDANVEQRRDLASQRGSGAQVLAWARQNFEPEQRFLLTWDSSSLADPRVVELADRLQDAGEGRLKAGASGAVGIDKLRSPHGILSEMVERGIDRGEAVRRLTGVLVGTGLLKIRLTDSGRAVRDEVERRFTEFARDEWGVALSVHPPVVQPAVADGAGASVPVAGEPVDEYEEFLDALEVASDKYRPSDWSPEPHDFQLRWTGIAPGSPVSQGLEEFSRSVTGSGGEPLVDAAFFQAGAPVALTISLTDDGDAHLQQTLKDIKAMAAEVGIPEGELRFGGSPIGRDQLNLESAKALWNPDYPWWRFWKRSPLGLSALVGALCAFLMLRSLRLAILVLVTSIYTAVAVVAMLPATGQTLNTVLLVMPNLLLVLTMSGAIHLANYWKHAAHSQATDPVRMAVKMAFEPCALASVTTAIGLASLLTSVLLPVRQFGLFSAIGCLVSLAMVLLAFPALLRLWPGQPSAMVPPHEDVWQRLGRWLSRHGRAVTFACLGAFVLSAVGLRWFRTETKVIRYFPDGARIVEDYQFLEDNLAGIISVDAIVRFPTRDEAIEEIDLFQRLALIGELQHRIEAVEGISGTLSLADFRRDAEDNQSRKSFQYRRNLRIAEKMIFENQAEQTREFVTYARTPLSIVDKDIPFRIELGEQVWRIRAQSAVLTNRHYDELLAEIDETLKEALKDHPGSDHVVTGMVPLFLRTQEALLDSLIQSFGLAFIVIAVVMMYLLRGVLPGLLTMLPNLLPVVMVFGAISWAGIPVDIGTMITASVALGIAVDGTLHLLTWFRDGIRSGLSREDAISRALGHCAPAMWQTSLAISLGLLMLAFTDLLLISRFGWLMAALIMAALVADVIYLPAMLSGALGRLIERTVRAGEDHTPLGDELASESPAPAIRS